MLDNQLVDQIEDTSQGDQDDGDDDDGRQILMINWVTKWKIHLRVIVIMVLMKMKMASNWVTEWKMHLRVIVMIMMKMASKIG